MEYFYDIALKVLESGLASMCLLSIVLSIGGISMLWQSSRSNMSEVQTFGRTGCRTLYGHAFFRMHTGATPTERAHCGGDQFPTCTSSLLVKLVDLPLTFVYIVNVLSHNDLLLYIMAPGRASNGYNTIQNSDLFEFTISLETRSHGDAMTFMSGIVSCCCPLLIYRDI